MVSNRLAFAALGFACVAAAGGSYVATLKNADSAPATAAAVPVASAAQPAVAVVEPTESIQASAKPVAKLSKPATAITTTARNTPLPAPRPAAPSPAPVPPPAPAPVAIAPPDPPALVARQEEPPAEPIKAPEPEKIPENSFTELVIAPDSVIGLQMETTVTSEHARVEDRVDARVIRDVRVNGEVAISSGSHAIGSVVIVDRGGKFKERARVGIRFNTLVLADGTRLPITTETIYRYGDAPSNSSAAKIGGGAVGGAILGAILGGAKGAAIGAAAGAGGGAAAAEAGDRSPAIFTSGTQLTARFLSPTTVTVER
jgi:hypothetical protein